MKLYLVAPNLPANSDREATDSRLRACIRPIADLITTHIQEDPGLFGMWHQGEVAAPDLEPHASYGSVRVVRLPGTEAIREALMKSGDPFEGYWMAIRSLVTCRSVEYGHDGQAFVCLMSDDPPMISPDESLFVVEECSHLLTESDYADGFDLSDA